MDRLCDRLLHFQYQISVENSSYCIERLTLTFNFQTYTIMPKNKATAQQFNQKVLTLYPGIFRHDNSVLFCLMCDIQVNAQQISTVNQHLETAKHKKSVERKQQGGPSTSQTLLTTLHETTDRNRNANDFTMDMAKCFLEANIPLHKAAHPSVKDFIEKHTKYAAPSEATLRNKCLPTLYEERVEKMKERAAGNYIWVSMDECTDCEQRFVANFVFGVLGVEKERDRSYLFASKVLTVTNSTTVAQFFDESISELNVERSKVLLVATDAAPYMVATMGALKILYPKMVHVTCAAHGLHRVAELVRTSFNDVNKLISNVKKTFTNAPRRKLLFQTMFSGIPLPPRPVITRWGTWIQAAIYFADNFEKFEEFFNELDQNDDAKCVLEARAAIRIKTIKADLAFIKSSFGCLPIAITQLEAKGVSLDTAISNFESVRDNLLAIPRRKEFIDKFEYVYAKNKGLQTLVNISHILQGEQPKEPEDYIDSLNPNELNAFQYAPIVSCDVERSFSAYNRLLEDCRRSFTFENLKKHVAIHCNKFN